MAERREPAVAGDQAIGGGGGILRFEAEELDGHAQAAARDGGHQLVEGGRVGGGAVAGHGLGVDGVERNQADLVGHGRAPGWGCGVSSPDSAVLPAGVRQRAVAGRRRHNSFTTTFLETGARKHYTSWAGAGLVGAT